MISNEKVFVELGLDSFTMLLNGLYVTYNQTHVDAIPTSLFLELAEKLEPFLDKWDYNKLSLESWIKTYLIILPKVFFNETEYLDCKTNNEIFIERTLGNVVLVCTAPISEEILGGGDVNG